MSYLSNLRLFRTVIIKFIRTTLDSEGGYVIYVVGVHEEVHEILSYKHHPYKHQYYKFEKLRTTSTKLSENKDHNTW